MKPSEIWSFPLDDGGVGFLRAILPIKDLELAPESTMKFVGDGFLVQISKSRSLEEATFDAGDILINGMFLNQPRSVSKFEYKRVGSKTVTIEEVEFPCWFADSHNKVLFCRGELEYELKGYDFKHILNNWDVRLIPCFPGQLGERVAQTQSYLENPGQVKGFSFITRSDLRYHPKKDDILNSIGVSISEPYYKVVEAKMGEAKLRLYKQAIIGGPKK